MHYLLLMHQLSIQIKFFIEPCLMEMVTVETEKVLSTVLKLQNCGESLGQLFCILTRLRPPNVECPFWAFTQWYNFFKIRN